MLVDDREKFPKGVENFMVYTFKVDKGHRFFANVRRIATKRMIANLTQCPPT